MAFKPGVKLRMVTRMRVGIKQPSFLKKILRSWKGGTSIPGGGCGGGEDAVCSSLLWRTKPLN